MPYRIELSPNNRAGCKDKKCKEAADKIKKGDLRFATHFDIGDHQGWAYKHWGCVTPAQIRNLNAFMEGQWELLEGLEDLPEDLRTKVRRACEQGHVDDEDWKWDPELNRPGAKRVIHKKKPTAKIGDDEDAANETVEKATKKSKTKTKKRARQTEDDADDDDDHKGTTSVKRRKSDNSTRGTKEEETSTPDAASKKPGSKIKRESTEGATKKAGKAEAIKSEKAEPAKRGAKSKIKAEEVEAPPKANEKKSRKPRARAAKEDPDRMEAVKDEDSAEDEKPLPKKRRLNQTNADAAPARKRQKTKVETAVVTAPSNAINGKSTKAPAKRARRKAS